MKDILLRLQDIRGHAFTAAERLEAAKEIKFLRELSNGSKDNKSSLHTNLKATITDLQDKVAFLEETIQFYADETNWQELTVDYGSNPVPVSGSAPAHDCGKLARKALKVMNKT